MTIEELQKEIDRKGKLKHITTVVDNFFRQFKETLQVEDADLSPFDKADLNGLRVLLLSAANRISKEPSHGQKAAEPPTLPAA